MLSFDQCIVSPSSEANGEHKRSENLSAATQSAIVVPCYNESARLRVSSFREFLNSDQTQSILIFVDDGSGDETLATLEHIEKGHEDRVVIYRQPVNCGKAEAVRCGMNLALSQQIPFVGFWDADLATPLSSITSFVDLLSSDAELDMVLGSRVRLLGHHINRSARRHYAGRVFATAASAILRLPIYDTQCGAKLFRCTARTRHIFERPFLSRWIFDVEIIARYISLMKSHEEAARRIYEFPLESWADVKGSKLEPRDFAWAAYDLFRIYREFTR